MPRGKFEIFGACCFPSERSRPREHRRDFFLSPQARRNWWPKYRPPNLIKSPNPFGRPAPPTIEAFRPCGASGMEFWVRDRSGLEEDAERPVDLILEKFQDRGCKAGHDYAPPPNAQKRKMLTFRCDPSGDGKSTPPSSLPGTQNGAFLCLACVSLVVLPPGKPGEHLRTARNGSAAEPARFCTRRGPRARPIRCLEWPRRPPPRAARPKNNAEINPRPINSKTNQPNRVLRLQPHRIVLG